MKALYLISIIGCLMAILLAIVVQFQDNSFWPIITVHVIAAPIIALLLSHVIAREIELFLHYQRIREIIFILEAAYFAETRIPGMFAPFVEQQKPCSPIPKQSEHERTGQPASP